MSSISQDVPGQYSAMAFCSNNTQMSFMHQRQQFFSLSFGHKWQISSTTCFLYIRPGNVRILFLPGLTENVITSADSLVDLSASTSVRVSPLIVSHGYPSFDPSIDVTGRRRVNTGNIRSLPVPVTPANFGLPSKTSLVALDPPTRQPYLHSQPPNTPTIMNLRFVPFAMTLNYLLLLFSLQRTAALRLSLKSRKLIYVV